MRARVGAFPGHDAEQVRRLVFASFDALHPRAIGEVQTAQYAVEFARERLAALDGLRRDPSATPPLRVLVLSTRNDGISQIAAAALAARGGDRVLVRSAGQTPADKVLRNVRDALEAVGLGAGELYPKPVTEEVLGDTELIVTMLCDAPPLHDGQRTEDWAFPDPAGMAATEVHTLCNRILRRVDAFVAAL